MKNSYIFLTLALLTISVTANPSSLYMGCFYGSMIDPDFNTAPTTGSGPWLPESCIAACAADGQAYAALTSGSVCLCANDFDQSQIANESDCLRGCEANGENDKYVCGNTLRNSVYRTSCTGQDCYNATYDYQECHDQLDYLVFDTIENECTPIVESGEQYYDIKLSLMGGYQFDHDCLTAYVSFEDQEMTGLINTGSGFLDGDAVYPELPLNQWAFFPDTNSFNFRLKHTELKDDWGCEYKEETEFFIWQCNMSLHVFLSGVEQYEYQFCMDIKVYRNYGIGELDGKPVRPPRNPNPPNVTVFDNEYVGSENCCENYLDIQTTLKFCKTFECDEYYEGTTLEVERKEFIYLEHSITSPDFLYYYLHQVQVKIGAFVPEIVDVDGSQPGRIIYKCYSNIALPSMVVEAISRIHDDPTPVGSSSSGRRLQADIGEDYNIIAFNQINIKEETEKKTESPLDKKQKEIDNYTIALIALGSIFGVLVLSAGIFFTLYTRKGFSQVPQKEQQQAPSDSGRNNLKDASAGSEIQINV